MFVITVINFLLFGLSIGIKIVTSIVSFREALTLDIEYSLSEKGQSIDKVMQNLVIVSFWSANLPVSSNLSLPDSMSIHARWRYYSAISLSFGGLGLSSKIDKG